MNRRFFTTQIGLLLFSGLLVSAACAVTTELITYAPDQKSPDSTQHVDSLTVGSPYESENSLPDGTAAVSGRFGIATTNPASRLHVIGSPTDINLILQAASGQTTTNLLELRDAANTTLLRINPAGGLFVKTNDRNILPLEIQGVLNQSADLLQVNDVNAKRLLAVTSTGAVGIGTSTPAGRLHVQGPDDAAGIATFMAGADTGAPGVPTMSMGIGTTTPTQRLHVSAAGAPNQNLVKFGDAPGALFFSPTGSAASSSPILAANARFDGTNWRYDGTGEASAIDMSAGNFGFFTAPSGTTGSSATLTERMRITNTGDVGIGTTAPAGRLHVQGVDDSDSVVTFMPGVDLVGGPTPSMRVGIGTTSPTATLEVQGSLKIVDGFQNLSRVLISDVNGVARWGSGNGAPKFITPVPITPTPIIIRGWTTWDASSVIPPGATAVILQAVVDNIPSDRTDYYVRIRKDSSSTEYVFVRFHIQEGSPTTLMGQGVFPITTGKTFQYETDQQITTPPTSNCSTTISIIGYY